MTDEEKKEYKKLKSLLYQGTISQYGKRKLIEIVEKQQKEIEELKQENKEHLEALTEWVNGERINDIKHISKDKIREKINYYRKYCGYDGVTSIGNTQLKELEELLEE